LPSVKTGTFPSGYISKNYFFLCYWRYKLTWLKVHGILPISMRVFTARAGWLAMFQYNAKSLIYIIFVYHKSSINQSQNDCYFLNIESRFYCFSFNDSFYFVFFQLYYPIKSLSLYNLNAVIRTSIEQLPTIQKSWIVIISNTIRWLSIQIPAANHRCMETRPTHK